MKRYIKSNSDDKQYVSPLSNEQHAWVGDLYELMNKQAFLEFPDEFPFDETEEDIASGDTQKYVDYFNDVIDDLTSYMKDDLKLSDTTVQKYIKKWYDIVDKFEHWKKG